jgi:DNA-binding NtrC family response regulator
MGIVRGHQGEIQVASNPGQGTTFTVLLPAAPGQAFAGTAAAGLPAAAPAGAEKRTILLVDDEAHVLETTRDMLEASGFTVVTASDGSEGVEAFRAHAARLSAVVLDMNMPRMDGAEAFRQMHRIAAGVPVILTSGLDEQDAVSEFTTTGLAGFIQKPYRMNALLKKVEAAIAAGAPAA